MVKLIFFRYSYFIIFVMYIFFVKKNINIINLKMYKYKFNISMPMKLIFFYYIKKISYYNKRSKYFLVKIYKNIIKITLFQISFIINQNTLNLNIKNKQKYNLYSFKITNKIFLNIIIFSKKYYFFKYRILNIKQEPFKVKNYINVLINHLIKIEILSKNVFLIIYIFLLF